MLLDDEVPVMPYLVIHWQSVIHIFSYVHDVLAKLNISRIKIYRSVLCKHTKNSNLPVT